MPSIQELQSKYPELFSQEESKNTSELRSKYPALFGEKEEGFFESFIEDIKSIPTALQQSGEQFQRTLQEVTSGKPLTGPAKMTPEQRRALAVTGSFAVGGPVKGLATKALGPVAKKAIGRFATRFLEGAAVGGVYTGVKEKQPIEGALGVGTTIAILPPIAARAIKGTRFLGKGISGVVKRAYETNPATVE